MFPVLDRSFDRALELVAVALSLELLVVSETAHDLLEPALGLVDEFAHGPAMCSLHATRKLGRTRSILWLDDPPSRRPSQNAKCEPQSASSVGRLSGPECR